MKFYRIFLHCSQKILGNSINRGASAIHIPEFQYSVPYTMPWFSFSRSEGYPTHYADQHTPAHVDILTAGFIVSFLILAIALFSTLPAYTGRKRWAIFSQIVFTLWVGGIVLGCNYGQDWETGSARITSAYKAGWGAEISGSLGLHVGLRGVNITLKGKPKDEHAKELKNETIDYNEHFSWEWTQGRFGFGPYAGQFNRDFRKAVYRGLPIPILQLAEYFTFDGEGVRWGRHFKTAGYYSHIMMWLAFPTWLITNILFCMVVRYAAMFLAATGICQLIAITIWTFVRNGIELHIPFEYGKGEKELETHFGFDYYLVLVNGILCVIVGLSIFLLDMCIPDELCQFFGIDPLTIYEECHLSKEEIADERKQKSIIREPQASSSTGSMAEEGQSKVKTVSFHDEKDEPETSVDDDAEDTSRVRLKRRTISSKLFNRSFRIKEKPLIKPRKFLQSRATSKVHHEQEMTVRTPLLRPPTAQQHATSNSSHDEESGDEFDENSDYINFPTALSRASMKLRMQPRVARRQ